jgi:hypothetical protein
MANECHDDQRQDSLGTTNQTADSFGYHCDNREVEWKCKKILMSSKALSYEMQQQIKLFKRIFHSDALDEAEIQGGRMAKDVQHN